MSCSFSCSLGLPQRTPCALYTVHVTYVCLISKQLDTDALKNFSNDFVTRKVEKLKVQVLQQTAVHISGARYVRFAHCMLVSLRHIGRL